MSERSTNNSVESCCVGELLAIVQEFVRLSDCGLRPQIVRGMHREEEDWKDNVNRARAVLAKGGIARRT